MLHKKNTRYEIRDTRYGKGFTFLELLIGITVITLLAAIGWSTLLSYRKNADLTRAVEEGASLLIEARAKTLASVDASQYGVHFAADRAIFFKGTSFVAAAADNREAILPGTVEISGISLNGGGPDVVFTRLIGSTTQFGTITYRLKTDPTQTRLLAVLSTGVISVGPPETVSSAGLVGYWPLNEGAGLTTADMSGNGNSGALLNLETPGDWVLGRPGMGTALQFDGTNEYVDIPGSAVLDVTGDLTVALWVRPSVDSSLFHSSWNFFVYQRSPLKYEIGYYNTNGPRFKPYNTSGTDFDFSPDLLWTAGTWYHVAMVRQGSFLGMYVNGILVDSRSDFTGDLRSSTNVRIGGNGGSSGFQGTIDDVRIYSRRLSDQEIGLLATM